MVLWRRCSAYCLGALKRRTLASQRSADFSEQPDAGMVGPSVRMPIGSRRARKQPRRIEVVANRRRAMVPQNRYNAGHAAGRQARACPGLEKAGFPLDQPQC
jgi:hypothetical protein